MPAEPALGERFDLIRRIADDLAHELKNPLNAMVINLEVLRARVRAGGKEAALERIDVLEEETRRLHRLLDSTLRLLRPDGPAGAFPADTLLEDAGTIAGVLARLAHRQLELRPAGDTVLVYGEREPLCFALLVLSEAALAAVPAGGSVILEARAEPDSVRFAVYAPGAQAGAPEAALERARRLLAGSGARLDPAPEPEGCRVRITVPRSTPGGA